MSGQIHHIPPDAMDIAVAHTRAVADGRMDVMPEFPRDGLIARYTEPGTQIKHHVPEGTPGGPPLTSWTPIEDAVEDIRTVLTGLREAPRSRDVSIAITHLEDALLRLEHGTP